MAYLLVKLTGAKQAVKPSTELWLTLVVLKELREISIPDAKPAETKQKIEKVKNIHSKYIQNLSKTSKCIGIEQEPYDPL